MKWIFLAAALNATGNLMLKFAANSQVTQRVVWGFIPTSVLHPYFIVGVSFFVVSLVVFTRTLNTLQLSVAYPVMASAAFSAVTVLSVILFQERLSLAQMLGLAMIIAGIFLLSRG